MPALRLTVDAQSWLAASMLGGGSGWTPGSAAAQFGSATECLFLVIFRYRNFQIDNPMHADQPFIHRR
jgi:hypothetical protein